MPIPSGHFTISVTGLDEIRKALGHLSASVKHETRVLTAGVAVVLRKQTNEAFAKEQDPSTGKPWAAWVPSYVKKLTRTGKLNHKRLQLSGLLRKNIQEFYDDNKAGLGVNLKYARIHQLGGRTGRGHKSVIPPRPYLGVDSYAKQKITKLVHRWIENGLRHK